MADPNAPPPSARRPTKTSALVMRRKGVRIPQRTLPPSTVKPPPPGQPLETKKKPVLIGSDKEPDGPFRDIPVVLTKKQVLEGLRFHIMKLQSDAHVDVTDSKAFSAPVRLHRRDPRAAPQPQDDVPAEVVPTTTPEEDKEREKNEALKEKRKREREETQAQIAPTDKQQQQNQVNWVLAFKNKVDKVHAPSDTPQARAQAQIKYEEFLKWHLEDDEGKNVWKGKYELLLSNRNAMMVFEGGATPHVRLVMLEKWYKFQEQARYQPLTIEEAEAIMKAPARDPGLVTRLQQRDEEKQQRESAASSRTRLVKVRGAQQGGEAEDLDFDGQGEFDDDDEGGLFGHESDIDAREAEKRVKKEFQAVNGFGGDGDAADDSKNSQDADKMRKQEKLTRERLVKKEKNATYADSSDESDPYASSSEEDSSDESTTDDKKEAETQAAAASQTGSTSTARTATTLKRPGSPSSEAASDLDSVRKRPKKNPRKPIAEAKQEPRDPNVGGASAGSDSEDLEDFFTDVPVIVTLDKIRSAIPTDGKGISLKRLLKRFKKMDKSSTEFVIMLKRAAFFNKTTKRIYPLASDRAGKSSGA